MRNPARLALVVLVFLVADAQAQTQDPADLASPDSVAVQIRALLGESSFEEAEALARASIARLTEEFGHDSEPVAKGLHNLFLTFSGSDRMTDEEALAIAQEQVQVREALFGPDELGMMVGYEDLGLVLIRRGEFEAGLEKLLHAAALAERDLPPGDPQIANQLSNVAYALGSVYRYEESVGYLERSLAAARLGDPSDEHRRTIAISLSNLGAARIGIGDVMGAKASLQEALPLFDELMGRNNFYYLSCSFNLAIAKRRLGDRAGAYRDARDARVVCEELLPGSPTHGQMLGFEAVTLIALGEVEEAVRISERAVEVQEQAWGRDHLEVAEAVRLLGGLQTDAGLFEEARVNLAKALATLERIDAADGVSAADVIEVLGRVEFMSGDLDLAREHQLSAMATREQEYGPDHPDVAKCHHQLGFIEIEAGNFERALEHVDRAIAIRAARVPDSPRQLITRATRAVALAHLGRIDEARSEAQVAAEAGRRSLRMNVRSLTEEEGRGFQQSLASSLGLLAWSAVADPSGPDPEVTRIAWDAAIRERALLLDEMSYRVRIAHGSTDPAVAALVDAVRVKRRSLANLFVQGSGEDAAEYQTEIEVARTELRGVEQNLADRSAAFRAQSEIEHVGFEEVAARVPNGTTLVAYLRYEGLVLGAGPAAIAADRIESPAGSRVETAYLAFVLRGGETTPDVVRIGPAAVVDAEVDAWRATLFDYDSPSDEAAHRVTGEVLRARLYDPVAARAGDAERVLIVPDGALHLVSFATLPVGDDRYLVEDGPAFHYLSAERDLAKPGSDVVGVGLLAMGGADYDRDVANPQGAGIMPLALFRGAAPNCETFAQLRFPELPGTALEVASIAEIWESASMNGPATVLRDADATETAFLEQAPGRRVVHLATHGFFLGSECVTRGVGTRGVTGVAELDPQDPAPPRSRAAPVLSGLALAGANARGAVAPGGDDGILTTMEIGVLDLRGVEWAVLSACDTGLGEIEAGEGVFGLRRAFETAGAQTLIMSLWAVADDEARAWMMSLYEQRFAKGAATIDAVRAATAGRLRELRARGESTHPHHWGAFVAAGRAD